jgi:hypothetical protein
MKIPLRDIVVEQRVRQDLGDLASLKQSLQSLGHQHVFSCEMDPHCRKVIEAKFGLKPYPDVETMDMETAPDCDVLPQYDDLHQLTP